MTWEAHQGRDFFGYSPPGKGQNSWQAGRWSGRIDIEEALAATEGLRGQLWKWLRWPDAQPFSGGVWDAWPARSADGLAFAKREWAMVQAYLRSLEA